MTLIRRVALGIAFGVCLGAVSAEAGQELTVTHYGSLLYGLPIAIADAEGWFAEEGATVDGVLTAPGGGTAVMSRSPMSTRPERGASNPATRLSRVDLPEPLGPSTAVIDEAPTAKSNSMSASP